MGRFGIGFVASPRHADGLLVTGPVPENMRLALLNSYAAVTVVLLIAFFAGPSRQEWMLTASLRLASPKLRTSRYQFLTGRRGG